MKNIIFIEGVSGVGKSTTVHKLSDRLQNLGYTIKSHIEGDPYSPLDLCWAAYLTMPQYEKLLRMYPIIFQNIIYKTDDYILIRYQIERTPLFSTELHEELHKMEFCYNPNNTFPISKFTEVFTNLWQRFVQNYDSKYDYYIFDATLVSHMTNDLISHYNASKAELTEHLEKLTEIIRLMNPLVFYLSSDDVAARLIKARWCRNQSPPDEERIEFWKRRKELDLSVLPQLSVKSQIVDITNEDWDSAVTDIISMIRS